MYEARQNREKVSRRIDGGEKTHRNIHAGLIQLCRIRFDSNALKAFQLDCKDTLNQLLQDFNTADHQQFVQYEMQGCESATTSFGWGWEGEEEDFEEIFTTKEQKHSEMCAIEYGLQKGILEIQDGQVVYGVGSRVTNKDMYTVEPHCLYCSFFLGLLGIERSKPTCGLFKKASNLNYPLPNKIKYNESILNNLAKKLGYKNINDAVNSILPKKGTDLVYLFSDDLDININKEMFVSIINCFWKEIYRNLNEIGYKY